MQRLSAMSKCNVYVQHLCCNPDGTTCLRAKETWGPRAPPAMPPIPYTEAGLLKSYTAKTKPGRCATCTCNVYAVTLMVRRVFVRRRRWGPRAPPFSMPVFRNAALCGVSNYCNTFMCVSELEIYTDDLFFSTCSSYFFRQRSDVLGPHH